MKTKLTKNLLISLEQTNREFLANEVAEYEQRKHDNANEIIEAYAGHSVFSRHTLQDNLSYREQKRQRFGTESNRNNQKRNSGKRSNEQDTVNVEKSVDSTDCTAEMDALDELFGNGEIDRDENRERINELYEQAGKAHKLITCVLSFILPRGESGDIPPARWGRSFP